MNESEMMAKAIPDDGIGGVIRRLKISPKTIRVEASYSPEYGEPNKPWVRVVYDYQGSLTGFGRFLDKVTKDVEAAGGYVSAFSLGTELRPANGDPDDFANKGKYRAMHVHAVVRTQKEAHTEAATWRDAVKSLLKNGGNRAD